MAEASYVFRNGHFPIVKLPHVRKYNLPLLLDSTASDLCFTANSSEEPPRDCHLCPSLLCAA